MFLGDDANSFVWLIFLGICIAAFYAYFTKKFLGGLIRKLIAEKAASESAAKTLNELGYSGIMAYLMKKNLVEGKGLRRYVEAVYPEQSSYSEDSLVSDANAPEQRYFLPFDKYELAEKRYDDKGTTFLTVLLTIVVFFFVALMTTVILPFFTGIFDGGSDVPDTNTDKDSEFSDSVSESDYQADANNSTANVNSENSSSHASTDTSDEEFSMLNPTVKSGSENNSDSAATE